MRVYVTNLGKYNEGELIGEWLELPATDEEIVRTQWAIQLDDEYEEYFITDDEDSPIEIYEYSNLDYLNRVAESYEDLNESEKEVLTHLTKYHGYDYDKAIEVIEKGEYTTYSDVKTEEDLGYALAENMEIPEHLKTYINYETIGREGTYSGWYIDNNTAYCIY